jgi:hypothetical protein
MTDALDALVLDLLEWIGPEPRPYEEVIAAWRTSCLARCGRGQRAGLRGASPEDMRGRGGGDAGGGILGGGVRSAAWGCPQPR